MADSGSDSDTGPPTKVMKSLRGAATYKTKFNVAWTKDFPFISPAKGEPHK